MLLGEQNTIQKVNERKHNMLKKTITFEDYDGNKRTEDFYFNLTRAEILEMEMGTSGGMQQRINKIIAAQDAPQIMEVFKEILVKAYGIKSDDGRRFIKSKEISEEFTQTEAYSQLFMELATDDKASADFINGIIPKDATSQAKIPNNK